MKSRPPGSRLLSLLLAACGLLAACSDRESVRPAARSRHLLLLSIDTLRTDRLRCYGGREGVSPHIDRLAERGVLYENAFTPRGMTLPSFTSLFTSRYPGEHGVVNNTGRAREEEQLLAERLAEAGFRTRAWVANGVLDPERTHIHQGFEPGSFHLVKDEEQLTRQAVRYLEEEFATGDQRDFLWVHYMNPHKPYEPPAEFRQRMVDPAYRGDVDGSSATLNRIYIQQQELTEADLNHIRALYDAAICYADSLVGRLLDTLERRGLEESTLVVFLSDHGEDLYSHNYYFYHGNSMYRSTSSVPLIFRQPGVISPGRRVSTLTSTLDFLPTMLSWLLGTEDAELRGCDLAPEILGSGRRESPVVFAVYEDDIFAIRDSEWLYIWNPKQIMPSGPPSRGRYPISERELYHWAIDPDEQHDRIEQQPEVAARLHAELSRWNDSLDRSSATAEALSPERLQELRDLGYLDAEEEDR